MARCIVLVPYLTHIEPACERGLRALEQRGLEVRRYPSSAAIDRTRSEMATAVLDEGFDEVMWIDSDIVFEADDVARLRSHELPIAAGVYAKRGTGGLALHLEADCHELRVGEGGGLTTIRYVGFGFVLIRRQVFADVATTFALPSCNTKFGSPVTPYFLPMVIEDAQAAGGYWYLGEDYAFCERARRAGHAVVVDSTIRLGHVGSYVYGFEDAAQTIPRVAGAVFTVPKIQTPP
jgi:hypothetical protein